MASVLLHPARVAATPWRNGAGTTRELAALTDPDGSTAWRVSVADLDRDAAFSTFPGLDRVFVALGPLRLDIDGSAHLLGAGDQVRFAGESSVAVSLADPCRALNVMTRRGVWTAAVALRPADGCSADGCSTDADLVVALGDLVADVRLRSGAEETGG